MIEISHLTKKYGTNVAVNDLNLTLEPGKYLWIPRPKRCRKINDDEYYYRLYRCDIRRSKNQRI